MISNGFAFTIRVRGEVNIRCVFRRGLERLDDFLFSGNVYIFGLKTILYINADFLRRQVPDMTVS